MPDAYAALRKGNHRYLLFVKDFPFPLRSSSAPTELRETGLILICRHELIADELWQLLQEGVCKVISAIKPSWVGCDFFFPPFILRLDSCTALQIPCAPVGLHLLREVQL